MMQMMMNYLFYTLELLESNNCWFQLFGNEIKVGQTLSQLLAKTIKNQQINPMREKNNDLDVHSYLFCQEINQCFVCTLACLKQRKMHWHENYLTNYEFGWGLHKLRTMDHYALGEMSHFSSSNG
jgi:hypothetical protein